MWTEAMWSSSFKHLILTVNRVSNIIPQTLHFLGKNVLNFLLSNWAIDKTKPVRLIKPTNKYNAAIVRSPACLIKESFHIISAHWSSMFACLVHVQRLPIIKTRLGQDYWSKNSFGEIDMYQGLNWEVLNLNSKLITVSITHAGYIWCRSMISGLIYNSV